MWPDISKAAKSQIQIRIFSPCGGPTTARLPVLQTTARLPRAELLTFESAHELLRHALNCRKICDKMLAPNSVGRPLNFNGHGTNPEEAGEALKKQPKKAAKAKALPESNQGQGNSVETALASCAASAGLTVPPEAMKCNGEIVSKRMSGSSERRRFLQTLSKWRRRSKVLPKLSTRKKLWCL